MSVAVTTTLTIDDIDSSLPNFMKDLEVGKKNKRSSLTGSALYVEICCSVVVDTIPNTYVQMAVSEFAPKIPISLPAETF